MTEVTVETKEGVFYVKALKYGELLTVLKNSGMTRIKAFGGEPIQWDIDIADVQYHLLLASVRTQEGPLTPEKLKALSIETVAELTDKALELTPIFRLIPMGT